MWTEIAEWLLVILVAASVYLELESLKASRLTQQALQKLFESRERWYASRSGPKQKPPTREGAEVEVVREVEAEQMNEPEQPS